MSAQESNLTLAALGLSLAGLVVAGVKRAAEKGSRTMKTPADLRDGVTVVLENPYGPRELEIGLVDPKLAFSLGGIRIFRPTPPRPWEVLDVSADQGYGPLLYDLAMECVRLDGGLGLIPDRAYVSNEAGNVWERYLAREDVHHKSIPKDVPNARRYHREEEEDGDPGYRPWLDNVFSKHDAPMLRDLMTQGKLDIRGLLPSTLKSALQGMKKQILATGRPDKAKLGSRATSPAAQEVMHAIAQAFKDDPNWSGISDRAPWRPISYPSASPEDLNNVRLTFELTALRWGFDTEETYEDVLDKLKRLGFTQPARVWRFVQAGKARVTIHVKDERLRLVVEDFEMRHLLGGTGDATPWMQAKKRKLLPMWRKEDSDAR